MATMTPSRKALRQDTTQFGMHPRKFTLWIFLVTVTMLFAGMTSAMVVRRADGNWAWFQVPSVFYVSCGLALLSSAALIYAQRCARANDITPLRISLWVTALLGCAFLASQYFGFVALSKIGVMLVGNPSGSFFYVVAGMHALHVIGGIIAIFATLVQAYRYRVHSRSMLGIGLTSTYWHFVGGLWIYLFAILILLR